MATSSPSVWRIDWDIYSIATSSATAPRSPGMIRTTYGFGGVARHDDSAVMISPISVGGGAKKTFSVCRGFQS